MQKAYAAHNRDADTVSISSSGGVFTAIAKSVIKDGGIVFGVAEQNGRVLYKSAENENDIRPLCGSKYVFVPTAPVISEIIEQVRTGRQTAVVCSPCQAETVRKRCPDADNLIVIDFVCHGAPEPQFLEKYIAELEAQYGSRLKSINFRKKKPNAVWQDYRTEIAFENGDTVSNRPQDDPYMAAFLKNASLRRACSVCRAKGSNRASDITLGDFWGVNKLAPDSFNMAGTSLIFTNTQRGEQLLHSLSDELELAQTDPAQAVKYNPSAVQPAVLHPQWDAFRHDSDSMTMAQLANKYCKSSTKEKLRGQIGRVIRKLRK